MYRFKNAKYYSTKYLSASLLYVSEWGPSDDSECLELKFISRCPISDVVFKMVGSVAKSLTHEIFLDYKLTKNG
jgi:hypothetical protein